MDYIEGLVSVVIPTHNREKLVSRAVDSALNQTYRQIEVIVVSDGSTDNTDLIMAEYEKKFPNFRYISYKPGKGGNYARNTGVKAANGEYVAFLDDDDEWLADKIEKQTGVFNSDPEIGIVCTAYTSVYDDSGKEKVFVPHAPYDSSVEILKNNQIGSTTTVCVRHELIDKVGMFDEDLCAKQDWDLWIRLCQITKVGVVKTPCVIYHNATENGQISWNYKKYADASEYLQKKYYELRKKKLTKDEIRSVYLMDALGVARKAFKANNRKIVRKYAKLAFRYKPNSGSVVYVVASFLPSGLVRRFYKSN